MCVPECVFCVFVLWCGCEYMRCVYVCVASCVSEFACVSWVVSVCIHVGVLTWCVCVYVRVFVCGSG